MIRPAIYIFIILVIIRLLYILFGKYKNKFTNFNFTTLALAIGAVFITISIVIYPDHAFQAAFEGLETWFYIVFPALLPFFIGSQLLMGLGVVHFMGVLLEPFMRPIFNVPGSGSFVMAMGLASGYPIGAMLTGKLRSQGLCSKTEAERLVSFTNTADPLFMFGAVAVGMFYNPGLGYTIAAAHYISSLMVGVLMRFYGDKKDVSRQSSMYKDRNIIIRGIKEMLSARKKDGRPFGKLLGDCIKDSINSLLSIGGFIILFSVIIQTLTNVGLITIIAQIINVVLIPLGISTELSPSIISGFFEITLGTKLASEAVTVAMDQRIMISGFIIAWSGLSVHAQVASMVSHTDINIFPYIIARFGHGILAAIVSYILFPYMGQMEMSYVIPVMSINQTFEPFSFLNIIILCSQIFFILTGGLILLAVIIHFLRTVKIIRFNV